MAWSRGRYGVRTSNGASKLMPEYKCKVCKFKFKWPHPGPCQRCGHDYVEWLNYKEIEYDRENPNRHSSRA